MTLKKTLAPALLFCALCGLTAAAPATAQPPFGGGPRLHGGPMHPEALADSLDLSETQVTQVEKIHAKTRAALEPLLAEQKTLGEAVRAALDNGEDAATVGAAVIAAHEHRQKIRALHEAADGEIEALLTAEQLTRWQALKAARRHMPPGVHGGPGFGPPRG
ncbi:MAG TPA: hypothetical protein DD490_05855 [Acidobacteria bacterium]|nr:hypothetical protein [Acidobacteriota bacterium]